MLPPVLPAQQGGGNSHGTVVFSRSGDVPAPPSAAQASSPELRAPITDAMRAAPAFTAYDLTVHLQPTTAGLEAEARLTVRNGGAAPLRILPLQLSSSLHFEQVRSEGKALPFAAHPVESDADHTGTLTEAAVLLPAPLPPGCTVVLTVDYAGTVVASSGRLDRAGASAALARETDWDQIGESFTALRGFGNTVWYPVASVPVLLGDGVSLQREVERQKARNSGATVAMAVTVEFTGDAPGVVALDGRTIPASAPASLPTAAFPGVFRVALPATKLGFRVPSLLLATRTEAAKTPLLDIEALPAHAGEEQSYTNAARLLEPLFSEWFGSPPAAPLTLADLPLENALPFDDGDVLLLSLRAGEPQELANALVEPLTHVYFHSERPWLREGVAGLMAFLWAERTDGRDKALEQLAEGRAALALAEPATPGAGSGQPLAGPPGSEALDPVYLRTKATYVLAMLRTLAGDDALRAALRAYDPAQDTTPDYFEKLLQSKVARVETGDLHRFFQNWVYGDPGLPDLAITNVFPSRTGAGDQWLVAVEVSNTGYAAADVPLTVRSAGTAVTVQLPVPARGSIARRVLLQGEPTEVDLNDGSVPEVEAGAHRRLIQEAAAPAGGPRFP